MYVYTYIYIYIYRYTHVGHPPSASPHGGARAVCLLARASPLCLYIFIHTYYMYIHILGVSAFFFFSKHEHIS